LQSGNNPGSLFAKVTNSFGDPIDGKEIKFSKTSGSSKISLLGAICQTGVTGSGECSISVRASDFLTDEEAWVRAECSDSSCNAVDTKIEIKHTPVCNISCPESYTVAPDGEWHRYSCSVSGEAGCQVDSCSKFSGSLNIEVQTSSELNKCEVKADTSARYDTAVSQATAGMASDKTNINVRALGWIETNP
jgi:hypothetical protein